MLYFLLAIFSFSMTIVHADVSSNKFKVGSGGLYSLNFNDGQKNKIYIYTAAYSKESLRLEYHFKGDGPEMVQQFLFKLPQGDGQALSLIDGYFVNPKEKSKPTKMDKELLKGMNNIKMDSFLISSKEDLKKDFINIEEITIPAGKFKAHHYRKNLDNTTVDFWIDHNQDLIGPLKMTSKSTDNRTDKNYDLILEAVVKNVKPVINLDELK